MSLGPGIIRFQGSLGFGVLHIRASRTQSIFRKGVQGLGSLVPVEFRL